MSPFVGELVQLSALRREDLPTYTRWFRDYDVQRFVMPNVLIPMTEEGEVDWYDLATRDPSSYTFGIRTLADDMLIGNCGLHAVETKNQLATFGIVIGEKEYWGRGYGTDATRAMLRFAFTELNLNRVQLEVYGFNPRGVRAYEKAGFLHEGVRRQALFREGAFHDIHLMAVLRDTWSGSA